MARLFAALGVVAGVIVFFVVILLVLAPTDDTTSPICRDDWTKCADNADLVNHWRHYGEVQYECKQAANDLARFGAPQWPTRFFTTFELGNDYVTNGVVKAIDREVKMQNGFGVYGRTPVTCTYDLKAKAVTNVEALP